jgi:subtilisin family serine protease
MVILHQMNMKKFFILSFVWWLSAPALIAQPRTWVVYFKDKGAFKNLETAAAQSLSQRALEKRAKRNIPLTVQDVPVSSAYLTQLQNEGATVLLTSRWMNMAIVTTEKEAQARLQTLGFVQQVVPLGGEPSAASTISRAKLQWQPSPVSTTGVDYGNTRAQIAQLRLDCLHEKGYQGSGRLIAVFDTGFLGVDTISAYRHIFEQSRMVATRNFVNPGQSVYSTDLHGSMVFSVIAALRPGNFVGSAPGASFALAVTERLGSETHQEEYNWLAAAEWADSLGADVIQSSLSYKYFDAGEGDYSDAQLDGKTAIITNAARWASSKGIIVVNSAGNDGTLQPPLSNKISPPCDADSILAVGSVDANGNYHDLSSRGNTADGRVKPDVVAMGRNTWVLNNRGTALQNNGTSLSTPLISGLVACLLEANPQRSYWEVMRAVVVSAHQINRPDIFMGYGIPDACKADSLLKTYNSVPNERAHRQGRFELYPNPAGSTVRLTALDPGLKISGVEVLSATGQLVFSADVSKSGDILLQLDMLKAGVFFLRVTDAVGNLAVLRLIKY